MLGPLTLSWHPVARSPELVPGHIFHGRLLGEELALWRDAENRPNAWENRCLHRGVRLTVGLHLGAELRCLYHGLRYSSGTGGCSAIPSLPGRELPRQLSLCVKTFPVVEKYGLVWVCLGECANDAAIGPLEGVPSTTLRSVVVWAPPARVADALRHYRFLPSSQLGAPMEVVESRVNVVESLAFACTSVAHSVEETAILIVQPADECKAIVHGVVIGEFDEAAKRSMRRHHNQQLGALRDAMETQQTSQAAPSGGAELRVEST